MKQLRKSGVDLTEAFRSAIKQNLTTEMLSVLSAQSCVPQKRKNYANRNLISGLLGTDRWRERSTGERQAILISAG